MDHHHILFVKLQGILYEQCPIDKASHTRPLIHLLGAQGDRIQTAGDQFMEIIFAVLQPLVGREAIGN